MPIKFAGNRFNHLKPFPITKEYKILEFTHSDTEVIGHLQPEGWNDIRQVFQTFINKNYFKAYKIVDGQEIIGVGELIVLTESAWIGNIIVSRLYRGKGLGMKMTHHLMAASRRFCPRRLLLLATDEAVGLYTKLGFRIVSNYEFFKYPYEVLPSFKLDHQCFPNLSKEDRSRLIYLDTKAYGEDRSRLLDSFFETGTGYKKYPGSEIDGFYLPDLGDGLIISLNPVSGIELMKWRINQGRNIFAIPEDNPAAIRFLAGLGYEYQRKATLMLKGDDYHLSTDLIFSRIGGYLG